jgi:hypothetical protein
VKLKLPLLAGVKLNFTDPGKVVKGGAPLDGVGAA